jgi:hypothetical protein
VELLWFKEENMEKIVSLKEYMENKEKLKGIPLTITLDGKPPIERDEESFEIPIEATPQEPTIEDKIKALEDENIALKSRLDKIETTDVIKAELQKEVIEPIIEEPIKEVKR